LKSLFSGQSVNILKAIGLKELGIKSSDDKGEMISGGLTNSVKEIGESQELQNLIQQVLTPRTLSTDSTNTNAPISETLSNVLFEQLEKKVDEVKPSDTDALKGLIDNLFGD
jgi:hypothetical protein